MVGVAPLIRVTSLQTVNPRTVVLTAARGDAVHQTDEHHHNRWTGKQQAATGGMSSLPAGQLLASMYLFVSLTDRDGIPFTSEGETADENVEALRMQKVRNNRSVR